MSKFNYTPEEQKLIKKYKLEGQNIYEISMIPFNSILQVVCYIEKDSEGYTLNIPDYDIELTHQKTFRTNSMAVDEMIKLGNSKSLILMGKLMKNYVF